jgi:ribosomal protein L32E
MKRKKFLRRNHDKHKRLGSRRKKLVWRRPKGIHNKMRERRKGYCIRPSIGMKSTPLNQPVLISNLKSLSGLKKGDKIIVARIGKKKRMELEKKAKELGVVITN